MNTEKVLKTLQELKPILANRYKVREIGLFGSFVREEQRIESDIDFLVEFENEADLFDLIGLTQYLEEVFQRPVDVVPRRALRPELQESVLQQFVKI